MMLAWLILIPILGGLCAWLGAGWGRHAARGISIVALLLQIALALFASAERGTPWLAQVQWRWIPQLGISCHLGMDGLSLLLILLTGALGVLAVAISWKEITERVGLFHLNLLLTVAGVTGVFLALDLFLFFFFWELMLVPMSLIIALWGHERRIYAAIKFFIFTQGSGLAMLVAIVALALAHRTATGVPSFDYFALLQLQLEPRFAWWLMLGFFVAFAVKLPAVPLHSWLPDAHTEAPTAGSVILAGVLLKTGAYGLLRFAIPLFPEAARALAPLAMLLGAVSILYGAVLAFAQTDMKRLIAYSSVSHMGFVLLGVFAWNVLALQGAIAQMIAHGISTGALFITVGILQQRLHTRDLRSLGGLAARVPRLAAFVMVFAVASLGLPGLGNFVGEFLVLLGAFDVHRGLTVLAALGLVTAAIYSLTLVQRALHGAPRDHGAMPDLDRRETAVLALLLIASVWLGLRPQGVLDIASPALATLLASGTTALAGAQVPP